MESDMKATDLLTPTGQALLRAYGCPVCGCRDSACGSLEAATPQPDLWCSLLEKALELRGWRQWAQQYQESEAQHPLGYRRYLNSAAYKRKRARQFMTKAWDHDQTVGP